MRPMPHHLRRIALTMALLGAASAMAEEAPAEPATELKPVERISLEELLDAPVVTATKTREKQHSTPAIVSVITDRQIADLGADTLYDVLATVPGLEVIETYYGYTTVAFRGIYETHYNDKSLLLIDGHPLYDVVNWSWYLEAIPLASIKQIEVVRGPGSTLYGTNAYAGVINIITKQGSEDGVNRAYITGGSFKTADVGFSVGSKVGELSLMMAAQHRASDGYPFQVARDEDGKSGSPVYPDDRHAYQDNFDNAFAKLGYRGLTVSGLYFSNDKDKFGLVPALVSTGNRHLEGLAGDAQYERALSDRLSFFAMAYYDTVRKEERIEWYPPAQSQKDRGIGGPEQQNFAGFKYGAEARLTWKPVEWGQVLGGVAYQHARASYYTFNYLRDSSAHYAGEVDKSSTPFSTPHEQDEVSPFLQLTGDPWEGLGVIAGARLTYNPSFGLFAAPRAGLVYRVTKELNAKLLYGRAYRSPSFFESDVNTTNVLYGGSVQTRDPNPPFDLKPVSTLRPEIIDTVDLGADWNLGSHTARLNAFYLTTSDMIDRVGLAARVDASGNFVADRPIPQYGNTSGYSVVGAEGELRGSPMTNVTYFLNASYRYAYQGAFRNKLPWRAPVTGNAGVTFRLPGNFDRARLTTYLTAVGPRSGFLSPSRDLTAYPDAKVVLSPYVLWNATLEVSLTSYAEVSLLLHNLLNQSYSYPEYIRARIESVPGGPPLSAYGRLTVHL